MKKLITLIVLLVTAIFLTACWPGEVHVETSFNKNGSGTRTIIIDVMDDLLSNEVIGNPDDPAGVEGKGPVLNDKYLDGGVIAIQGWLKNNAPDFVKVEDAKVDGYHRYFTLTFDFKNFNDFLEKYEKLVNLSKTVSWDDFDAKERPTLVKEGNKLTFKESKEMVLASIDWAIQGIWDDLIVTGDLTGWISKEDISVLAGYKVEIGGEVAYEEIRAYDPNAIDGEGLGKVVFVESDNFTATGEVKGGSTTVIIIVVAVVVLLGVGGALVLKKKK